LGAVDPVGFREKAGDATLAARPVSTEWAWRVNPLMGSRYRTATSRHLFPGGVKSWLATQGVRGRQVGVNPLWRAVVAVGVASQRFHRCNPEPEKARLAFSRKG